MQLKDVRISVVRIEKYSGLEKYDLIEVLSLNAPIPFKSRRERLPILVSNFQFAVVKVRVVRRPTTLVFDVFQKLRLAILL